MSEQPKVRQRCFWCLNLFPRLTRDHVIPLGVGGPHHWRNIVRACAGCNQERGTLVAVHLNAARLEHLPGSRQRNKLVGQARAKAFAVFLPLQRKWELLERERLGFSPSAELELVPPIPDDKPVSRWGAAAWRKAVQAARVRAERT